VTAPPAGVSERAMRVYRDAVVIDAHNDLPSKVLNEHYDPDARHASGAGHSDLPRLLESGLAAVWLVAWVDAPYARHDPGASFARAMRLIDVVHDLAARHPDRAVVATRADDVLRARREGRLALCIGVEGGHAIESSLDNLRAFHARGARYLTLTWNNGNDWAGSSIGSDDTRTGGLTAFGESVVRELNRLGMLVDLSHVSEATFADAVAVSSAPVIASHSSARALADHPRNLTDDQLRAVARTGGVVCVNFFPRFIDAGFRAAIELVEARAAALAAAQRAAGADPASADRDAAVLERELAAGVPRTPLAVLVDHIAHIARVAGVEHVGLGSDFDGITYTPAGMEDVTALPRIAQSLLDRGWPDRDIHAVLGGNLLRVMRAVL